MTILPKGLVGRFLFVIWLAACVAVLVIAFEKRDIRDTDIGFAWLMIYLTFPIGYGLAALMGIIFTFLYDNIGIVVPGGFMFNLASWPFFVVAGFFQWFVVVPWMYRKLIKSSNKSLKNGTAQSGAP